MQKCIISEVFLIIFINIKPFCEYTSLILRNEKMTNCNYKIKSDGG